MTVTYIYNDANGNYLGTIVRNINDAGKKAFRASKGFPEPRPLYGLDRLAQRPAAPVIVAEGEKVADAASKIFPDHVCVTSPFGAMSAAKADWTPVHGRKVTIWPDNDAAGAKYAAEVAGLVPGARVVPVPATWPDGWDLADDLPEGITLEALGGLLLLAEAPKAQAKAKAKAKKPSTDDLRKTAEEAKRGRDDLLRKIKALLSNEGRTKEEAKIYTAKARELAIEYLSTYGGSDEDLEAAMADVAAEDEIGADIDGDALLDDVHKFLLRFVSYPSRHASVAHTLWIAHTHMMDIWDSTPRIAFTSPERGSGKTRALEATEFLVPRPVASVNNSVAYLIRKIADQAGRPTILYDEVDALFGNKVPEKADLLAVLNAGHRKGKTSGRCVTGTGPVRTEELPAYCALALAGLRDLPDTIGSRSIFIEMRRRSPDEPVEPFRERIHKKQAGPLYGGLAAWAIFVSKKIAGEYPEAPEGITDRDADCWEPLLAVADAAGGDWPQACRDAAVYLVRRGKERTKTSGVELLLHILEAFGDEDRLWTEKLVKNLTSRDESPWAEEGRKPALSETKLASLLRRYGIKSKQIRVGDVNRRGYAAEDFVDAWKRYLDPAQASRYTRYTRYIFDNETNFVAAVAPVAPGEGNGGCPSCDGLGCPTCHPENYGMKPRPAGGYGKGGMQ